jgi:coproporphyrinogen III oxidase-like Fe-S oxidoreductase
VNERLFLGLRSDGVHFDALRREFGWEMPAAVETLLQGLAAEGALVRDGETARLTSKGYLLCDEIATRLFIP